MAPRNEKKVDQDDRTKGADTRRGTPRTKLTQPGRDDEGEHNRQKRQCKDCGGASSYGGVGPERGLRGGGRRGWCEEWARRG